MICDNCGHRKITDAEMEEYIRREQEEYEDEIKDDEDADYED